METTQRKLQPPRVTERPFFRGVIHQIFCLPEPYTAAELSELIAAHRLLVSRDGMSVAVVSEGGLFTERIEHNLSFISHLRFRHTYRGERIRTQILDISANRLLVWGLPVGTSVCGVYEYRSENRRPRLVGQPFSFVRRTHCTPNGIFLIGKIPEESSSEQIWTRLGSWTLQDLRSVSSMSDGSYILLEGREGDFRRYCVTANGFADWAMVRCTPDEQATKLVRVQNQYVIATRSRIHSRLSVVGATNTLTFPMKEKWQGEIEHLWVSPSERSLAWLVRPDVHSDYRQIYLNGNLVHEGTFSMNEEDLVWAPSGATLGARITTESAQGQQQQSIVTLHEERCFPPGTFLREFLIDTEGKIAATITDKEDLCTPFIYDRKFADVPMAWNLHWAADGGIAYSSVLHSIICTTTDNTEILRH
jgi:hypothetical protein